MDMTLDADQESVVEGVGAILRGTAGPDRAREVGPSGHDDELLELLGSNGFLDLFHDEALGPLGAALVAEAMSRALVRCNAAIRTLVAPALLGPEPAARVAVCRRPQLDVVRFGQHADVVLILDGAEAHVADITGAQPVASPYGYPYASIETGPERSLGDGSGDELERWWRVALAVEIAGAAQGAVACTVAYLSQRTQFGKPLGSLQALQHRLAEAYIWSEGATWLARRAAGTRARAEDAATAAAYAAQTAERVGSDMHQLSGAIGFTTEFDLQLWTTRLHALRVELGGVTAHQLAAATAYWG